ncbi:MAG: hypothetical protein VX951_01835 [Planctomycetota bacterium]|nr:hypothetical protein [Planctomycetota bacterium]
MSQTASTSSDDAWCGRLAWLLFVVSAGLYFVTRQAAIAGDGIYFGDMLQQGRLVNHHLLYLPLVWAVQTAASMVINVTPELAMKLVSALAGGVGVSVTFLIASRTLQTRARSLVAAVTMMGLLGYWFHSTATELHSLHAASAALLMLGLLRALDGRQGLDPTTWLLCAVGTLLVPLSHMSGYAAGLPVLYAICRVGPSLRRQLAMAVATGALLFGVIYGGVYFASENLGSAVKFAVNVSTTGFSWSTTQGVLVQFTLYALPVMTLVPAGLRVLFRTSSLHGWFCLLWVIAWPVVSLRHVDDLYGSYHTATYPAAVILAVVALHGLAKTRAGAVVGLALASAPAWFLWNGDRVVGLIAWSVAATVLFLLAGRHVRRPRWSWLMVVVTFALTVPILWPVQRADLIRDRIEKISQLAAPEDLVLVVPTEGYDRFHWSRFFLSPDGKERAPCPADLDWLAQYRPAMLPNGRDPVLQTYEAVVRDKLSKKMPIWFVGEIAGVSGSADLNGFFDFLRRECRFEGVETASLSIYRLVAKK